MEIVRWMLQVVSWYSQVIIEEGDMNMMKKDKNLNDILKWFVK
jgi:hypothetical protein